MAATSPDLRAAIERHVAPLWAPVGLASVPYPERVRSDVVAWALSRKLSATRTFIVSSWCDAGSARDLRFCLDVREGSPTPSLTLTFPFTNPGYPPARAAAGPHFWLNEFQPERSSDHFERAIQFLGGLLVTVHAEIAAQVPELEPEIHAAAETPAWRAAIASAPELWGRRLVQGDVDPTELPAKIVFLGERMITLGVGTERVSFKFPTAGLDKQMPAFVSGWWTTPAGTRSATLLRIGERRWRFDFAGNLIGND